MGAISRGSSFICGRPGSGGGLSEGDERGVDRVGPGPRLEGEGEGTCLWVWREIWGPFLCEGGGEVSEESHALCAIEFDGVAGVLDVWMADEGQLD